MNDFLERMLASKSAEALEWLNAASDESFRTLGEMSTTRESLALVEHLYKLGAKNVIAVRIDEYDAGENTGHLFGYLPRDRFARSELFTFEHAEAESRGYSGTPDDGQSYLYFKLD